MIKIPKLPTLRHVISYDLFAGLVAKQVWESIGKTAPQDDPQPAVAPQPENIEDQINQIIIDNPDISPSTFLNLLKQKGFQIVKTPIVFPETMGSSGFPQVLRKNESKVALRCNLMEGAASDNGIGYTKFRVILIQEGLGNFNDAFYYTREALASGVTVFEGKKIYADHPGAFDDQNRPERTVRDIIGHFENVRLEENDGGGAMLTADCCTVLDEAFSWARALMVHAVEYAKKYPDKDFVGLSINAFGDAETKSIEEFLRETRIPESAQAKLQMAVQHGITEVRVCTKLFEAVSVDLVTEAGAGGRIIQLLEQEKGMSKKKETKVEDKKEEKQTPVVETDKKETKEADAPPPENKPDEKPAAAPAAKPDEKPAPAAPAAGQDDVASDDQLIQKMLKDHLGEGYESNPEAVAQGKKALSAAQKMGHQGDEAYKCAGSFLKMSQVYHEGEGQQPAQQPAPAAPQESKKEEAKTEETTEKKESAVPADDAEKVELKGENARLKRENKKMTLEKYLDDKLAALNLPRAVTDEVRECVGKEPKDEKQIDGIVEIFMKGYKHVEASPASGAKDDKLPEDFFVMVEKTAKGAVAKEEGKTLDFDDCVRT